MTNDNEKPTRRSPRLENYDYSQHGVYFVTICVQNRKCLFGEIVNETMKLNDAGVMIDCWWRDISQRFSHVVLDEYVIMPNHVHGLVAIINEQPQISLSQLMQWFKTMTTNDYIKGVKECDWEPFPGKLWQRSFFDHIVRNDKALERIREYIVTNPMKWELDENNPSNLEQK